MSVIESPLQDVLGTVLEEGQDDTRRRRRKLGLTAGSLICAPLLAASFIFAGKAEAKSMRSDCAKIIGGYAYAGVEGLETTSGISATITELAEPQVLDGHVAAWVGVGGEGLGPNYTDEWLQVGISEQYGEPSQLYYEAVLPGKPTRYVALKSAVDIGTPFTVGVQELVNSPNHWGVYVNGHRKGPAFLLRDSHGAFKPDVVAESWEGMSGSCNGYEFGFNGIKVRKTGRQDAQKLTGVTQWHDQGYRLVGNTVDGFIVRSIS